MNRKVSHEEEYMTKLNNVLKTRDNHSPGHIYYVHRSSAHSYATHLSVNDGQNGKEILTFSFLI